MNIHLPQRICRDVHAALGREWLVTNGIGGFAAGTVAGALTRRYHGLLLAALNPPLGRRLLVAKLDETATVKGEKFQLYTNVWRDGVERPPGCALLERFDLIYGVPRWTFGLGGARLAKRIWMEPGQNVTYVRYELDAASPPLRLECRMLVNDRDYHLLAHGVTRTFQVQAADGELVVRSPDTAAPIRARCVGEPATEIDWDVDYAWCRGFVLPAERTRGFEHVEDHLAIGSCRLELVPGAAVTVVLTAGVGESPDVHAAWERQEAQARARLAAFTARNGLPIDQTPVPIAQLVLAADQFIVARPTRDEPDGHTIMAGYPWFTDWGRDTMISLPGLTLVTGRPDVARQILRTWAHFVDQGLIPNRFPDAGDQPEYNTADATLWYLWAIDQYVRATGDVETLVELFPVMQDVIARYRWGTRHHICVGDDGLVRADAPGVNLTWMDAKIGSRVVTPRTGKPVELSALWYDALCNMARLADLAGQPDEVYMRLAMTTQKAFGRFWNADQHCCFDVLDGPHGHDASVRPNQIFAVALSHSPLSRDQQLAVVGSCEHRLLTWYGLRSLAPGDWHYRGHYAGGPVERDEAYHQGTAWGWLLGPFLIAHYRLHRDVARVQRLLEPLLGQLWTSGLGTLSEIFDGDEPHAPNGCFAQAWSVAEALRAWRVIAG